MTHEQRHMEREVGRERTACSLLGAIRSVNTRQSDTPETVTLCVYSGTRISTRRDPRRETLTQDRTRSWRSARASSLVYLLSCSNL